MDSNTSGHLYSHLCCLQFQKGLPAGRGMHKRRDGSSYAGTYRNGQRSGQGIYLYANGDRYALVPDETSVPVRGIHLTDHTQRCSTNVCIRWTGAAARAGRWPVFFGLETVFC